MSDRTFDPLTGHPPRSAAFLCSLAVAALVYLLLALQGAHRIDCSYGCHDAMENAHLPRATSDVGALQHIRDVQSANVVVDAAPPGPGGPALVALVTALVAVLLGFFPVVVPRGFHATVEAVLGIGRWHRTVVLHL